MSVENRHIGGDASVGRNATMGGNARVQGNVRIGHNLRVDGRIECRDIKAANKGLFWDEAQLKARYPQPEEGWFAGVGSSSPFAVYIARSNGRWERTTGTFSVDVDMDSYNQRIDELESQLESNNALIAELIEIIREGGGSADLVMITIENDNPTWGSVSGGGLKRKGSITVTATAENGYHFVEWQDAEGNTIAGAGATYTFDATESVTLKAVFAVSYYTVSVGTDQGNLADDVSKTPPRNTANGYVYDEEVTVTAVPKQVVAPAYFVHWEDAQGVVKSTSAEYSFNVTENVTLKAVFDEERLITTDVVIEEGETVPRGNFTVQQIERSGTVVSGNRVRINDRVTLTATGTLYKPSALVDGSGNALGEDFTIESIGDMMKCTFTYTGTQTLSFKAVFDGAAIIVSRTITVEPNNRTYGNVHIEVNGENVGTQKNIPEGTEVTLVAQASSGFLFDHWEYNGSTIAEQATHTVQIDGNKVFTAVFVPGVIYGEMPSSITGFSSKAEAVITAITEADITAAVAGHYMSQATELPIPESSPVTVTTTGAKSYMLAIVPANSNLVVKQDDGFGSFIPFDSGTENHHANGELTLTMGGKTYKVFGQYASAAGTEFTITIESNIQ